jgi:hypothetical protein
MALKRLEYSKYYDLAGSGEWQHAVGYVENDGASKVSLGGCPGPEHADKSGV